MSTILIVDDNALNRKLLRVNLQKSGFGTIEAEDGSEALALLQRSRVSAIVSDILMPNMDGFRLCFEVRRHAEWASLPIILYTATYTAQEDERLALEAGANRFFVKPDDMEKVIGTLKEFSAAGEASAPPSSPREAAEPMKLYSEDLVRTLMERVEQLSQKERQARKVRSHLFRALSFSFRTLGRGAEAVLFGAGTEVGVEAYEYLKANWLAEEDDSLAQPLVDYMRLSGLCSEAGMEVDRERSRLEATVVGGFEASAYERTERASCHFMRGFLAGVGGRMIGLAHPDCSEVECEAAGKPRCRFVVKPLHARDKPG